MRLIATRVAAMLLLAGAGASICAAAEATPGRCGFQASRQQFRGTPLRQARCLLRDVGPRGLVKTPAVSLPSGLARWIDQPMSRWKVPLRQWLAAHGVSEDDVGGSLDAPLSMAALPGGRGVHARYFVIHDTSWPFIEAENFPDEDDARVNDLTQYAHSSTALAHVFVNRRGQSMTTHGFDEPWRATKLENRLAGPAGKGLFLHVELVQPRRSDPSQAVRNDSLAPSPGFTPAQYDRLALLYWAASIRAGRGLVPCLHATLDDGFVDGHDDPQNFELTRFDEALRQLAAELGASASRKPQASGS